MAVFISFSVGPEFEQYADRSQIQTRLELRLRQSGVTVMTDEEMVADPRQPVLAAEVIAVKAGADALAFAISLRLALNQRLWRLAQGKPVAAVDGHTWETSVVLHHGRTTLSQGSLGRVLDGLIDEFLNDWLATHPK